jgi:SAM-dependent methyltransferase
MGSRVRLDVHDPSSALDRLRRTRRRPRPTQHDYLHLRRLLDDLEDVLPTLTGTEALDVYCGARPYEHLLPPGIRVTGLDIADDYGVADVVSERFLPFEDARFDAILCTQAFYYVTDPVPAVAELRRVLRPGGRLVLTTPHVQEYDRAVVETRFTGPGLAALFAGWEDVEVRENGGRSVVLTSIAGRMLLDLQRAIARREALAPLARVAFPPVFALLSLAGLALERLDRRIAKAGYALPANLLITARAPGGAGDGRPS